MSAEITRIKNEIQKLEKQLDEERQRLVKYKSLPLDRRIAVYMHDQMCRYNHTDQCGCLYHDVIEEATWKSGGEWDRWFKKAQNLQGAIIRFCGRASYGEHTVTEKDVFKAAVDIIDSIKGW